MPNTDNAPVEAPSAPSQPDSTPSSFNSDFEGLKEAANQLQTRREETSTPEPSEPERIGYPNGRPTDEDGAERPLKLKEGAEDLARYRKQKEQDALELDKALNPENYQDEPPLEHGTAAIVDLTTRLMQGITAGAKIGISSLLRRSLPETKRVALPICG